VMRRFQTIAILALAVLAGCGGSEEDQIELVKVSGTITKHGKPLAGAMVSFIPGAGNKESTLGSDQTGPDGDYLLKFKGRTGVAAGKYKVIVEPGVELPPGTTVAPELQKDPMMMKRMLRARAGVGLGRGRPTDIKQAGAKSEFEAEVDAGAVSVTLDFDVKASSSAKSTASR
jgi:hypothetical protein